MNSVEFNGIGPILSIPDVKVFETMNLYKKKLDWQQIVLVQLEAYYTIHKTNMYCIHLTTVYICIHNSFHNSTFFFSFVNIHLSILYYIWSIFCCFVIKIYSFYYTENRTSQILAPVCFDCNLFVFSLGFGKWEEKKSLQIIISIS